MKFLGETIRLILLIKNSTENTTGFQKKFIAKCAIAGAVFLIGMILYFINPYWKNSKNNEPYISQPEIQATVQKIAYSDEFGLHVVLKYFIDGEEKIGRLDRQISDFKIGEVITVYYDEMTPEIVYYKYPNAEKIPMVIVIGKYMMILSVLYFLIEFIKFFVKNYRMDRNKSWKKE